MRSNLIRSLSRPKTILNPPLAQLEQSASPSSRLRGVHWFFSASSSLAKFGTSHTLPEPALAVSGWVGDSRGLSCEERVNRNGSPQSETHVRLSCNSTTDDCSSRGAPRKRSPMSSSRPDMSRVAGPSRSSNASGSVHSATRAAETSVSRRACYGFTFIDVACGLSFMAQFQDTV